MNILKNGKIRLAFDKKGFIKSLKYGDKEYISAAMPVFNIAFRDKSGTQTTVDAFATECTACEIGDNSIT